jgi:hypothetical protein
LARHVHLSGRGYDHDDTDDDDTDADGGIYDEGNHDNSIIDSECEFATVVGGVLKFWHYEDNGTRAHGNNDKENGGGSSCFSRSGGSSGGGGGGGGSSGYSGFGGTLSAVDADTYAHTHAVAAAVKRRWNLDPHSL